MIVAAPSQPPACIDFNAWAPVSTAPSYGDVSGVGPQASVIPNVVAGLSAALKAFGSLTWAEVIAPAIRLAENGFIVGPTLERALEDAKGRPFVDECFSFENGPNGTEVRQPALASILYDLAERGPRWFYEGELAIAGSRWLTGAGHETTPAQWRDALESVTIAPPPSFKVDGVTFYSSPLGTSGSICMFAVVDAGAKLAAGAGLEEPTGIRAWAERVAAAWSYRFGVSEGNTIAPDEIEAWIARAAAFKPSAAPPSDVGHTCHLNAADRNGMMVAATFTHGMLWFGGRWALPDTGIIMNYGGRAFAGVPPKIVAGRAHAVTNMSPTVALADDGTAVAIGTPGARRIATIVGLVLSRHFFGGVPLQEAIARGRFHAESTECVTLETDRHNALVETELGSSFTMVKPEAPAVYYGPCTAIRRGADGALTLGLDDRWKGYGATV